MELEKIYNEDCLTTMSKMQDEFIDLSSHRHHTMIYETIMAIILSLKKLQKNYFAY